MGRRIGIRARIGRMPAMLTVFLVQLAERSIPLELGFLQSAQPLHDEGQWERVEAVLYAISDTSEAGSAESFGVILPFMAIGIIMLLAMTMISVDVAYMQLVRTELRAASDAAAKAGAEALARTQTTTAAVTAAMTVAELNTVAGKPFKLNSSNVIIGTTTQQTNGSWTFASGGTKPNSVRISLTMNNASATGPVDLMFGRAFKSGAFTPSEVSTASAVQQEICLAIDRSASMSFDLTGVEWDYPRMVNTTGGRSRGAAGRRCRRPSDCF